MTLPDLLPPRQIRPAPPGREEDPAGHRALPESQPLLGGREAAHGACQGRDKEEVEPAQGQEALRPRGTDG